MSLHVCLCTDFFYPSVGGIETHVLELGKQLYKNGYKVCIITRSNGGFEGKHLLFDSLTVYYLKRCSFGINSSLPTFYFHIMQLYKILIDEKITHVHSHQSTSSIGLEVGTIAHIMGLKVFLTEHSLLSLNVVGALHLNFTLMNFFHCCDQVIAVSNIQKLNIQERVGIKDDSITVIPNGVDTNIFKPCLNHNNYFPTIVVVTRFEKRRGGEIIIDVVKRVCNKNHNVKWVIAGAGSLFDEMKKIADNYEFSDNIELLGYVPHKDIVNVLQRGQFFLNCSLTDAFCISNVEAASCGLYVVSTDTGGIPEVLPEPMRTLVSPCPKLLAGAILDVIKMKPPMNNSHDIISKLYSWENITQNILNIYKTKRIKDNPFKTISNQVKGRFLPIIGIIYYAFIYIFVKIISYLYH